METSHSTVQEFIYFHDGPKLKGSCLVNIIGNEARLSGLHGKGIYLSLVKEMPNIFTRHRVSKITFVVEAWHRDKISKIKVDGYEFLVNPEAFSYDNKLLYWATIIKK